MQSHRLGKIRLETDNIDLGDLVQPASTESGPPQSPRTSPYGVTRRRCGMGSTATRAPAAASWKLLTNAVNSKPSGGLIRSTCNA